MAVVGVVVVEGGCKLDVFAKALLQSKHGVDCEVGEVKILVGVLLRGIGAEDKPVKDSSPFGFIYHTVDLFFGEYTIKTEKGAGCFVAVSVKSVGDVADGCFCSSFVSYSAFDVFGFDYSH